MEKFEQGEDKVSIEVEPSYEDFVPDDFWEDPVGYFETEGENIKSGEVKYDESGKVREDPTATRDLPTWENSGGKQLRVVAKRVNTEKGEVGKSGNPFHEYEVMQYVAERDLPCAEPVARVESDGTFIIVMERVPGFRYSSSSKRMLLNQGWTEEDINNLLREAEEEVQSFKKELERNGIHRSFKLKDVVFQVDVENKTLEGLIPVDWERTKIESDS